MDLISNRCIANYCQGSKQQCESTHHPLGGKMAAKRGEATAESETAKAEEAKERLRQEALTRDWGKAGEGYVDEEAIKRFLDSESWDLKKSLKKYKNCLEWRHATRPWEITCEACGENPRSHSLRCVGRDNEERPVIFTSFAEAERSTETKHNVSHLTRISEEAERMINAKGRNRDGRWVWTVDFQGFTIGDSNPSSAFEAANLLDKYPNRLETCYLIDPPPLFSTLWNMVKPVLSEPTRKKVHFVPLKKLKKKAAPVLGAQPRSAGNLCIR